MKPLWLLAALLLLLAAWQLRRLGRTARVLVVLAAAACAVLGSGVVDLPSIETIVSDIGSSLGRWTYLLVGVNAFLETGAFLGFVAPGETMVLFGGVLAGNGTIELIPLIAVVWGSCVLGDLTSYLIGRRYGRDFLLKYGAKVKVGEPQVQFVERFFERHGTLTLFAGRWIGVVRPLVPFLAGSTRLSFARFAAIDLVSTFLWSTALCVLGSIFWQNFDELTNLVGRFFFILGAVALLAAALAFVVTARRSPSRGATIDRWLQSQQSARPVLTAPARRVWALVGRVEPHLPGAGGSREQTAKSDTVAENAAATPGDLVNDHPDLDR